MTVTRAVSVQLRQPATFGRRPDGNTRSTREFIPGQTLRGAMAAAWIGSHGNPNSDHPLRKEFERLFEGGVVFGPLFAAGPPMPMTMAKHKKTRPARCPEWLDTLAEPLRSRCGRCGGQLEPSKGNIPVPDSSWKRHTMHVRRAADGVAVDGNLFSREVVAQDVCPVFTGLISGDEGLLERLAAFTSLSLGGARSTQGAAYVRFGDPERSLRVDAFREGSRELVVRLVSPGIFVDRLGRPASAPTKAALKDRFGVEIDMVSLAHPASALRWTVEGGWHAASGLPKPEERAVAAGAVYRVGLRQAVTDEALAALVQRGLGLRSHEGFGAVAPYQTDAFWPTHLTERKAAETPASGRARDLAAGIGNQLSTRTRDGLVASLRTAAAQIAAGQVVSVPYLKRIAEMEAAPAPVRDLAAWAIDAGDEAALSLAADLLEAGS